jgi:drug/metabolite transporter (DMT)-like permease
MNKMKIYPALQAVSAAVLFGISTPLAKLLLGNIEPVPLASFLYLGSGLGLVLLQLIRRVAVNNAANEAALAGKDVPWLIGAVVFGGILAPIISMLSLRSTPASTASLLLNFEGVATTLIALLVFKENIGKRVGAALALITLSSILLSWDFSNRWGVSAGALGIILACVCWGLDNNFTRNISAKNPFAIVSIKGLGAGLFSLCLSLAVKSPLPDFKIILGAMLLGFLCYGLSIVLFVLAMRNLGSARTSAFFGTAPFIGALLSFIVFRSVPNGMFIMAFPVMILGTVLLLRDKHEHKHFHEPVTHAHKHSHTDGHHNHAHEFACAPDTCHSHLHAHEALEHVHNHMPDINHRHKHIIHIFH